MKLGFGTQLWTNYGNNGNFYKMLDELSMLHFDGFEMGFNDRPAQLKELLDIHRLEVSGCYKGINYKNPDLLKEGIADAKRIIDFYSELECRNFLLDASIEKHIWQEERDFKYSYTDDQLKNVAETANMLGEYAINKDMQLAWHTHWGTFFEVEELFERFWELTDASLVGLCCDTGQCAICGYDPVYIIKKYLDRIKYLHYKDVTFAGRPQGVLWPHGFKVPNNDGAYAIDAKGRWVELGRGIVDFPTITKIILDAGYNGWIVDDFDFSCYPPMLSAKACKDYINLGLNIWGDMDVFEYKIKKSKLKKMVSKTKTIPYY